MIDEKDFLSYISTKPRSADRTIWYVQTRFRYIMRWLDGRELSKSLVEQFILEMRQKQRSNSTLNNYLYVFYLLQKYCKDRELPYSFYEKFESFPQVRIKPLKILSQEEVEAILAVRLEYKPFHGKDTSFLDTVYRTFTMALAYTGARFDEMASLKVMYCDLSHNRITFPATTTKGKEERSVFITEPLVGHLKVLCENKKPNDLVFQNMMGNKLRQPNYEGDLNRRAEEAGVLNAHPHKFRRTYATYLYIATRDIGLVQVVLGHKDISSTMIYIKIADDVIRSGMYTHPFIRNYVGVETTIRYVEEQFRQLKLDEDPRFNSYKIRDILNALVSGLHLAVKTP